MEIKIFRKSIFIIYHHIIMNLDFGSMIRTDDKNVSLHRITADNIDLLDGGYFSLSSMRGLLKVKRLEGYYLSFKGEPEKCLSYCWVAFPKMSNKHYRLENIESYLFNISTLPQFRGNGYCGQLIDLLAQNLEKRNIYSTTLAVVYKNKNAIHTYEKTGFKKMGRKIFIRFLGHNIPYYIL